MSWSQQQDAVAERFRTVTTANWLDEEADSECPPARRQSYQDIELPALQSSRKRKEIDRGRLACVLHSIHQVIGDDYMFDLERFSA